MTKVLMAASLLLCASLTASAQTTAPSTTATQPQSITGAPTTPTTPGTTTGATRSLSTPNDQIQRLQQQGYSDVQFKDDTHATANKGGKSVNIQVKPDGSVTEE